MSALVKIIEAKGEKEREWEEEHYYGICVVSLPREISRDSALSK